MNTGRTPSHSPQAGVALIEVLVSILLFSIGVLGLIGLQARAVSFSTDAEDRNRAALLANDIASAMWLSKSTTGIDTSKGSTWEKRVSDPTQGGLPNGTVAVTAVAANSADIVLTWKAPTRSDADASSTLTTRVTLP